MSDLWEAQSGWWVREFSDGADPEYVEQILPMAGEHLSGARSVLDIGCGEGQLSRLAADRGAALVVGVDPTSAQLAVARQRGGGPVYARAQAAELPFPDGAFDAVVACLVFEHVDSLDRALAEVGRVTREGGHFLLFMNHPLLQAPNSGWIDDQVLDPPEQYWRIGPYLEEHHGVEEMAPGVHIPFIHRPLSRYVNGMAAAGLLVHHMAEPAPPPGFLARAEEYRQAASIPRLLFLLAYRHPEVRR
ncbi:MAG: class I SAM-dependent methyltransferase [Acidimicrobiales bacterium]